MVRAEHSVQKLKATKGKNNAVSSKILFTTVEIYGSILEFLHYNQNHGCSMHYMPIKYLRIPSSTLAVFMRTFSLTWASSIFISYLTNNFVFGPKLAEFHFVS